MGKRLPVCTQWLSFAVFMRKIGTGIENGGGGRE